MEIIRWQPRNGKKIRICSLHFRIFISGSRHSWNRRRCKNRKNCSPKQMHQQRKSGRRRIQSQWLNSWSSQRHRRRSSQQHRRRSSQQHQRRSRLHIPRHRQLHRKRTGRRHGNSCKRRMKNLNFARNGMVTGSKWT